MSAVGEEGQVAVDADHASVVLGGEPPVVLGVLGAGETGLERGEHTSKEQHLSACDGGAVGLLRGLAEG